MRGNGGEKFIRGLEVGLGIHSAKIQSNIPELNALNWIAEGGKVVIISGGRTIQTTCGIGFYYSAASVPQTVDLFYSELGVNFYPLSLTSPDTWRISPYVTGGAFYNLYKFGGTYLNNTSEPRNQSVVDESYIGRINQLNAYLGGGIEYRFIDDLEFLLVFAEANWARPFLSSTSASAFDGTSTAQNFQGHIGVRFGLARNR